MAPLEAHVDQAIAEALTFWLGLAALGASRIEVDRLELEPILLVELRGIEGRLLLPLAALMPVPLVGSLREATTRRYASGRPTVRQGDS